jgi:hypothetical protein
MLVTASIATIEIPNSKCGRELVMRGSVDH